LCRTANQPDVTAFGKKIIESLGVQGISETEIVLERKTGNLFVLEINARHWLQHRLSTCLGVNITLLDYYHRNGDQTKADALIAQADPQKKTLWIDDLAYVIYFLKNLAGSKKLHIQEFWHNQLEFSLLERRKIKTAIFIIKKMALQILN
jgi:predicted ATP-grasp superfamily ATP-dependent carboligase